MLLVLLGHDQGSVRPFFLDSVFLLLIHVALNGNYWFIRKGHSMRWGKGETEMYPLRVSMQHTMNFYSSTTSCVVRVELSIAHFSVESQSFQFACIIRTLYSSSGNPIQRVYRIQRYQFISRRSVQ